MAGVTSKKIKQYLYVKLIGNCNVPLC